MRNPENRFKRFICRNQKLTVMMCFPRPKQTASRLAFLTHSNESGRSFGMQLCNAPLWTSYFPPFLSSPVRQRALFYTERRIRHVLSTVIYGRERVQHEEHICAIQVFLQKLVPSRTGYSTVMTAMTAAPLKPPSSSNVKGRCHCSYY
jgi:hypothetical protein